MTKWVLLFITVPVLEIIIYVELGRYIGLFPTLLIILGTGIAGVIMAKQQGIRIITKARQEIQAGRVPGNELLDGLLLLVGALLLLTPGLLTDIAGLFLLFSFSRHYLRGKLKIRIRNYINSAKINTY